jgi:hypothetical protein
MRAEQLDIELQLAKQKIARLEKSEREDERYLTAIM